MSDKYVDTRIDWSAMSPFARAGLDRKLATVCCPDHGQRARLVGSFIEVEPCCETFRSAFPPDHLATKSSTPMRDARLVAR